MLGTGESLGRASGRVVNIDKSGAILLEVGHFHPEDLELVRYVVRYVGA